MTAFKYFMKTERLGSSGSFVHAICPARYRIGEAERSVGVKPEERRRLKLTHAWQLLTMTDKPGRLLTDMSTKHAQ